MLKTTWSHPCIQLLFCRNQKVLLVVIRKAHHSKAPFLHDKNRNKSKCRECLVLPLILPTRLASQNQKTINKVCCSETSQTFEYNLNSIFEGRAIKGFMELWYASLGKHIIYYNNQWWFFNCLKESIFLYKELVKLHSWFLYITPSAISNLDHHHDPLLKKSIFHMFFWMLFMHVIFPQFKWPIVVLLKHCCQLSTQSLHFGNAVRKGCIFL